MVAIPKNDVTKEDIATWYKMHQQLGKLKSAEMLLRNKIFKGLWLEPVEGTNKYELDKGFVLKATYPITRKVDIALLTTMSPELRTAGIMVDNLVKYKPELVVAVYRTLTTEQQQSFDRILEIKPGSPQLEIVQPKRLDK
jgi:hypothetical protein